MSWAPYEPLPPAAALFARPPFAGLPSLSLPRPPPWGSPSFFSGCFAKSFLPSGGGCAPPVARLA
jgi:hypothetical protein